MKGDNVIDREENLRSGLDFIRRSQSVDLALEDTNLSGLLEDSHACYTMWKVRGQILIRRFGAEKCGEIHEGRETRLIASKQFYKKLKKRQL